MKLKHPRHPEDITPEWLTYALRQAEVLRSSKVKSVDIKPTASGKAWLSTVYILRAGYGMPDEGAPESYVLKMLSESRASREAKYELEAYSREINFYLEFQDTFPIRLPKLYYSQSGRHANFMLMDDLSSLTPGDLVAGLSREETEITLDRLARVQAVFWENHSLNRLTRLPVTNCVEDGYAQNWHSFKVLCGDFIEPRGLSMGEKLRDRVPWLIAEISKRPITLVNDDMKADNLLFGNPDSENAVVILDWQFAIRGLGAIDAARLIGGSELPEERAEGPMRGFNYWYDCLRDYGVTRYSRDEAERDFKLGALYNLLFPVRYHGGVVRAEGRSLKYIRALYSRLFSFAADIGAVSILP